MKGWHIQKSSQVQDFTLQLLGTFPSAGQAAPPSREQDNFKYRPKSSFSLSPRGTREAQTEVLAGQEHQHDLWEHQLPAGVTQ